MAGARTHVISNESKHQETREEKKRPICVEQIKRGSDAPENCKLHLLLHFTKHTIRLQKVVHSKLELVDGLARPAKRLDDKLEHKVIVN